MSTVGLALIARDEEKRIPNLLASIEGAFDQVVLLDTGSTDRTVHVFKEWAKAQEGLRWEVGHKKWKQDFGLARRQAQAMLDTDWEVWADCDDVIAGAPNIRNAIAQAPDEVAAFIAIYNYGQHPETGQCIVELKRERLVRRGMAEWVNRVHEAQVVNGPVMTLGPEVVHWVHQKQYKSLEEIQALDARRNLSILEKWYEDEPNNTRVLAYLGTENAAQGNVDEAIEFFAKYRALNPVWDEEHAQVNRKMATCYMMKGEPDLAIQLAMAAMQLLPKWTDSYITLAEAYHMKGDHEKAIEWATEALRRGKPDTLMIINPLDYSYQPRKILAGSLAAQSQFDRAIELGTEAWQLNPMDEELQVAIAQWRALAKREHTANTVGMLAQQLIAHDEQWKALTFLNECVPHFVADHPGVVNLRSHLRERLLWIDRPESLLEHYATGGSKPEDFLPEDQIDRVAGSLPRVAFLYEGIYDQLTAALREGKIEQALAEQLPAFVEAFSGKAQEAVS